MDFEKLVQQRQTKATATSSPETDAMLEEAVLRVLERSKPGPKRRATSKRNSPEWRAQTFYLQESTKEAIDRYMALTRIDDRPNSKHPADQSELIDAAITAYLSKRLPALNEQVKQL